MSTYSNTYQLEQQRRQAEREAAPKRCPHCGTPINEHLSEWDKVRFHCGADKCRKAASRINVAERKRQARVDARARILRYCEQHLDREQKHAVMNMCDLLMQYSHEEGHQIAEQVVQVLEARACKHDRINELEDHAALWQRRAQASERQLKERIAELETELELFTTLHNTIHGIATQQLQKQPDPQEERQPAPEQEDPDRARVLAVLAQANIKPYTGKAEDEAYQDEGGDDTEE